MIQLWWHSLQLYGKEVRTHRYAMPVKLFKGLQHVMYHVMGDRRGMTLVVGNIFFGCFDHTSLLHCARSRISGSSIKALVLFHQFWIWQGWMPYFLAVGFIPPGAAYASLIIFFSIMCRFFNSLLQLPPIQGPLHHHVLGHSWWITYRTNLWQKEKCVLDERTMYIHQEHIFISELWNFQDSLGSFIILKLPRLVLGSFKNVTTDIFEKFHRHNYYIIIISSSIIKLLLFLIS